MKQSIMPRSWRNAIVAISVAGCCIAAGFFVSSEGEAGGWYNQERLYEVPVVVGDFEKDYTAVARYTRDVDGVCSSYSRKPMSVHGCTVNYSLAILPHPCDFPDEYFARVTCHETMWHIHMKKKGH